MEDWQKKYLLSKAQGNPILNSIFGNNDNNSQQQLVSTKSVNTCSIRAGSILYRKVDTNGFGTTAIFVVPCGTAPTDFSTKEFEYKIEPSPCYLLENQMQVRDAGRLNDKQTLRLIRVSSPMIGSFLVQESNLVRTYSSTNNIQDGKSILKG